MIKLKEIKQFIHSLKITKIRKIKIKNNKIQIIINKNTYLSYKNKINYSSKYILNNIETTKSNNSNYLEKINESQTNNTLTHSSINSKNILLENDSSTYLTIISPMVGTFYRSPGPNEPVFIEKNDTVQKKQIVCIIEAMKLMNEIESEVEGEIIEILVNDGDIVDCGQALMKVKRI